MIFQGNDGFAFLRKSHGALLRPMIDCISQACGLRSAINGFCHGLKIARQLSIFAPVYTPVPPFRIQSNPSPTKSTTHWVVLFIAKGGQ
jgi:hypothetical protein